MAAEERLGAEVRRLLALAVPCVITQVGMMTLGVVDTLMVGRVGVDALGAAALGGAWTMSTLVIGMGLMLGVDPIITQAHGAGDHPRVGLALQRGLLLALVISIPFALLWRLAGDALVFLGQDPAIAALAHDYLQVQIPSIPAFLAFFVLRQYLNGRGLVAPAMWVILGANILNVIGNQWLIFGGLGLPPLGLMGAGIATMVTRLLLLAGLALWIRAFRLHVGAWPRLGPGVLDPAGLREVLGHGIPIAAQISLEMWAFQAATLLAGALGSASLAAHTIVLNLSSLTFMMPLGVSMAAVIRVGNLLGAGRHREADRAAWVAIGTGAALMGGAALAFVALRGALPRAYTEDALVIGLAAQLLPIAAAFQLFDGTQVVGGGVLRAMGRPRPAAVFNLIGYYALGLPVGAWMVYGLGMGVRGIWWGLTIGLGVVAGLFVGWIWRRGPGSLAAKGEGCGAGAPRPARAGAA